MFLECLLYNRDHTQGPCPLGAYKGEGLDYLTNSMTRPTYWAVVKSGGGAAKGVERKKATLARNWELLFWKNNFTVYTKPVINMQH